MYQPDFEKEFKFCLFSGCIVFIFVILCFGLMVCSCNAMPEFFHSAEEVLTNDAISIQIYKEAFDNEADVNIQIDVKNKEEENQHAFEKGNFKKNH